MACYLSIPRFPTPSTATVAATSASSIKQASFQISATNSKTHTAQPLMQVQQLQHLQQVPQPKSQKQQNSLNKKQQGSAALPVFQVIQQQPNASLLGGQILVQVSSTIKRTMLKNDITI
jgi:hypothetical protein